MGLTGDQILCNMHKNAPYGTLMFTELTTFNNRETVDKIYYNFKVVSNFYSWNQYVLSCTWGL